MRINVYFIIILVFMRNLILGEVNIFPFFNRLYTYDIFSDSLTYKSFSNTFSMEFFAKNEGIYLSRRSGNDKEICFYKNSCFQPVQKADISSFFIIDRYIITVANTFIKNKGFLVSIFSIESDTRLKLLDKQYIDLFISDYQILDDGILLSGTSEDNKYNCIYLFKSRDLTISLILKVVKHNDFLKIINSDNRVFFYNSSSPDIYCNLIYTMDTETLLEDFQKKVNYLSLMNKSLSFYGKGFLYNKRIFIPMINDKSDIFLTNITIDDKNLAIINKYPIISGLYKNLGTYSNFLLFIGYNYYKEKSSFYLVKYNLINHKSVFIKKLI